MRSGEAGMREWDRPLRPPGRRTRQRSAAGDPEVAPVAISQPCCAAPARLVSSRVAVIAGVVAGSQLVPAWSCVGDAAGRWQQEWSARTGAHHALHSHAVFGAATIVNTTERMAVRNTDNPPASRQKTRHLPHHQTVANFCETPTVVRMNCELSRAPADKSPPTARTRMSRKSARR